MNHRLQLLQRIVEEHFYRKGVSLIQDNTGRLTAPVAMRFRIISPNTFHYTPPEPGISCLKGGN